MIYLSDYLSLRVKMIFVFVGVLASTKHDLVNRRIS